MPAIRARSVRATPDFARIRSLPRRKVTKAKAERHAEELTPLLALRKDVALRAWQGQALYEVRKCGGGFLSLPVGQGKTLICESLPVLLKSKRSVLIAPASLESKTYADRRSYAGVWRMASPPPRFISTQALSLDANAYLLDEINGTAQGHENLDLILIDEGDELSNWKASAIARIDRFLRAKRRRAGFGEVRVVVLTGTPTRKSILGYWHLLVWCLGDLAPVPLQRAEAETWAAALDEASPRAGFRSNPGPLGADITAARAWYLDRLEHTPGVLLVDEDSAADVPLTIDFKVAPECPEIDGAFDTLRTRWESPSGEPVTDPLSLNRIEGHLGCGLYTYWQPPPPQEWSDARREIAAFIRKRIAETRHAFTPLDTEAQVIRAHREHPVVLEWARVKGTFNPLKASRTKWISDATLEAVARWMCKHSEAGRTCVVWCGSVDFGRRLAELAKVPYYGRQGVDEKSGRELHNARTQSSMVCSWHANKRGFNLQAWTRHAIVLPPQSAKFLEQIFGRSHRAGQNKPVRFTIWLTSGGVVDSFRAAVREARFAQRTIKNTQKILRADVQDIPELPEGLRWAPKPEDE